MGPLPALHAWNKVDGQVIDFTLGRASNLRLCLREPPILVGRDDVVDMIHNVCVAARREGRDVPAAILEHIECK